MKQPLIVICGPTATGKTALSTKLAQIFDGEILSADSMQVYRGMDIGTAKINPHEMKGIPHHMIDICKPNDSFSVREYQEIATPLIMDIYQRQHTPFLVGGTGLYIESITHGYEMPDTNEDPQFRNELEKLANEQGNEVLFQHLVKVDPHSAERIHLHDRRRLIRALEVYEQTGRPFSHQTGKKETMYHPLIWIGLTMPRDQLYERINQRVDQMLADGWLDEVKQLKEQGYHLGMTSMQAIGYKELMLVLLEQLSYGVAVEKIKQGSRKYAKRQLSWFRRREEIHWFDMSKENTDEEIQRWVAGEFITNRE